MNETRPSRAGSLHVQDLPSLSPPPTALTRDLSTRGHLPSADRQNEDQFPFVDVEPVRVPPRRRRPTRPVPNGVRGKILVFLGIAGPNAKARRELLNVIWKLGWGFVQVRLSFFEPYNV